jgi:hypothetical protein
MKARRLALRVTLNSILMILAVYFVMQLVSYLRDGVILGLGDLRAMPGAIASFLAFNVLPPTALFSGLLYFAARPIQRAQERLEAGEELPQEELELTRHRILRFSSIVLALNLAGFALGYVLLLALKGQIGQIISFDKLVILFSNLAGGVVYAEAQSALNRVAFAPLR